jgi:hypothetical protein
MCAKLSQSVLTASWLCVPMAVVEANPLWLAGGLIGMYVGIALGIAGAFSDDAA